MSVPIKLQEQIERLIEIGKQAVDLSDCHKSGEPSLSIRFQNDGTIDVDFYSYCLELNDGKRHHTATVDSMFNLSALIQDWIVIAETEIKKMHVDSYVEEETYIDPEDQCGDF